MNEKLVAFGKKVLAVLLSDVMCAVVAYNYRGLVCGIEHAGFSAPADIALLLAMYYLLQVVLLLRRQMLNQKSSCT